MEKYYEITPKNSQYLRGIRKMHLRTEKTLVEHLGVPEDSILAKEICKDAFNGQMRDFEKRLKRSRLMIQDPYGNIIKPFPFGFSYVKHLIKKVFGRDDISKLLSHK